MGSSVIPGGGLYQGGTTWVIDEEAGAFAISRMDHNGRSAEGEMGKEGRREGRGETGTR
jgi:hypothetical protein